MLNGLMKSNGWFPTMFDDFFNTDFMPRANSTDPQSMSRRVRRPTRWNLQLQASRKNIAA